MIFAFALAALLPSLVPLPMQRDNPATVVHDMIPLSGGFSTGYSLYEWKTDLDGDGVIELALWAPGEEATLLRGGDLRNFASWDDLSRILTGGRPYRKARLQGGPAINRGGQLFGVSFGFVAANFWDVQSRSYFTNFFDLETGSLEKKLLLSDAFVPGMPPLESIESIQPLGDLDDDGFDEVLVLLGAGFSPFQVASVIDGKDLEVLWLEYFPTNIVRRMGLIDMTGTPWEDIDGDGWGDITLAIGEDQAVDQWNTLRVSGATGEVLWQVSGTSNYSNHPSRIADTNSDGVADIFFYANSHSATQKGAFWVISGADGSVVWRRNVADYDRHYSELPPEHGGAIRRPAISGPDLNLDGTAEIVLFVDSNHNPNKLGTYLFYLCGETGDRLMWEEMDISFQNPWEDGELQGTSVFIGDVNNDGWPEFVGEFWTNEAVPQPRAVLMGHQTLRVPNNAQEGDTIQCSLHLPTGSNRPYRLYLSTSFDSSEECLSIGGWDTYLGDSLLLGASLQTTQLRGVLGAGGTGSHRLRIPVGAGLAGKTIYAIAIVEDTTNPSGVLTKSTVSSIEILP
ncbi:MAG: FG-GAP repeat domain-containing protein [Planctomycetota bacterium]